jgi:hypothetical protein
MAHEGLDDFQGCAGFAPGPASFEIRRQLAIRAQDFLIAHLLFASAVTGDCGLASFDHTVGSLTVVCTRL